MFDSTMAAIGGDSGATVWHEPSGYGRNWGRFSTGVVHSTDGAFTHIEDLRASLGLGPPVGF